MGLTQKLGTIPLAIQTDSSNNVGIGGAANASYKLAVTGNTLGTGTAFDFFTSSGIGSSGVTGLLRVVTAGTSTGIAIGQANSSRYTAIQPNEHIIYNDDFFMRTNGAFPLSLGTNNTIRMTITSSGNVGIGTSSPTAKLAINADWVAGGATVRCYPLTAIASGGVAGYGMFDNDGTTRKGYINVSSNYMEVWCQQNSPMTFGTNDIERMRITSGGYVKQSYNGSYINTSGLYNEFTNNASGEPGIITTINGASIADATVYMASYETDHNNTTAQFFRGRGANTTRIRIYSNGNIQNTNGSYGTLSSDLRLKENINEANPKLNDILKLRVVNFNLIEDVTKKKQIGFIAQEFQEVFPSLVQISDTREYDEDGNVIKGLEDSLSLNVGMEFAILVKAIQELSAKVTALENK